jgi:hypothetical protein
MPSNFKVLSGASGEPNDPNFKNVTLLLHGDGSNGAQNNTFLDSSTNNFTITRNGNTTQGSFSPYGSNWSNYFDGSGDYLTVASNAAFGMGTGDFTIELWVNPIAFNASGSVLVDMRSGTEPSVRPDLEYTSSGVLNYRVNGSVVISGGTLAIGTWSHVAIARSGTTTKLFLNGVQVGSSYSDSNNYGASAACRIGADDDGGPNAYVNGYMSNVRVVKGTAVYTSNFTPSTTPLTAIANTSLLTCQSNRFRDASTNNFTITRNGDVKVTNFAPFAPSAEYGTTTNGGSAYFDGTGDYLTTTYTTSNFDWYSSGVDFTIEYWFYANSLTGISYLESGTSHSTVIGNRDATSTTDYWSFGPTSAGTVTFYYYNGGSVAVISSATFNAGSWNHVAMTKTSSGITVFVNGVAGTTTAISGIPQSSTGVPLTIGQGNNSSYNGYVSNLRIVRGTAIYSGNFTPPTSPVTAVTNTKLLLNATNGAIFDNSMKNDLETVGNAQISTSVKKFGTGSMALDGSGDYLLAPDNSELDFGTGNFTIEMWMYAQNLASIPMLFHKGSSGSNGWFCQTNASTLYFGQLDSARYSTWSVSLSNNTWYHIALTRIGSSLNVFINGVSQTAQTVSGADQSNDNASPLYIGVIAGGTYALQGYLDEYRITKGVARYTANFTPPTAAFPNK